MNICHILKNILYKKFILTSKLFNLNKLGLKTNNENIIIKI